MNKPVKLKQNPHGTSEGHNVLEKAIGRQVRSFRTDMKLTVTELAKAADLSSGMLSKIENGQTSPSLATLNALSKALHVPVTALFRQYEEASDAVFVKAGQGLDIQRRGTRAGHHYQLLGHSLPGRAHRGAVPDYVV